MFLVYRFQRFPSDGAFNNKYIDRHGIMQCLAGPFRFLPPRPRSHRALPTRLRPRGLQGQSQVSPTLTGSALLEPAPPQKFRQVRPRLRVGAVDLPEISQPRLATVLGRCFPIQVYEVVTVSRSYRQNFSQAYKVLYKEGELSYLTEILDSAQEGTSVVT